eukprot:m51a1_g7297 hypothetical protein (414) ;mRNA; f:74408-76215
MACLTCGCEDLTPNPFNPDKVRWSEEEGTTRAEEEESEARRELLADQFGVDRRQTLRRNQSCPVRLPLLSRIDAKLIKAGQKPMTKDEEEQLLSNIAIVKKIEAAAKKNSMKKLAPLAQVPVQVPHEVRAAVRIQAAFRGHRARTRLREHPMQPQTELAAAGIIRAQQYLIDQLQKALAVEKETRAAAVEKARAEVAAQPQQTAVPKANDETIEQMRKSFEDQLEKTREAALKEGELRATERLTKELDSLSKTVDDLKRQLQEAEEDLGHKEARVCELEGEINRMVGVLSPVTSANPSPVVSPSVEPASPSPPPPLPPAPAHSGSTASPSASPTLLPTAFRPPAVPSPDLLVSIRKGKRLRETQAHSRRASMTSSATNDIASIIAMALINRRSDMLQEGNQEEAGEDDDTEWQ